MIQTRAKLLMSFWWMGFDFKVINEQGLRIVLQAYPPLSCYITCSIIPF